MLQLGDVDMWRYHVRPLSATSRFDPLRCMVMQARTVTSASVTKGHVVPLDTPWMAAAEPSLEGRSVEGNGENAGELTRPQKGRVRCACLVLTATSNKKGFCGSGQEFCETQNCQSGNCTWRFEPDTYLDLPWQVGTTPDGSCGGQKEHTCDVVFGNCCSKAGVCGSEPEHCGKGW